MKFQEVLECFMPPPGNIFISGNHRNRFAVTQDGLEIMRFCRVCHHDNHQESDKDEEFFQTYNMKSQQWEQLLLSPRHVYQRWLIFETFEEAFKFSCYMIEEG